MPAGRSIPYSKQITKVSRRLIGGAKISSRCDLSARSDSRAMSIALKLNGSAPNLIQINGIAVIAVAQVPEKDL